MLALPLTGPDSDATSLPPAENILLPIISFSLYPEEGLLKIANFQQG